MEGEGRYGNKGGKGRKGRKEIKKCIDKCDGRGTVEEWDGEGNRGKEREQDMEEVKGRKGRKGKEREYEVRVRVIGKVWSRRKWNREGRRR